MKLITALASLALAATVLFSASVSAGFAPLEVFAAASGLFIVLAASRDYARGRQGLVAAPRVTAASAERLPYAA